MRQLQAYNEKEYLESERRLRTAEFEKQQRGKQDTSNFKDIEGMAKAYARELEDPGRAKARAEATNEQIFVDRDNEMRIRVEAEVQKKLTKASKYFAGKLTQALGLRYAPDLRFYIDDSKHQMKQMEELADQQYKDI